jgi:RNA polymerase sigma factor (sigma-70 family)
VEQLIKEYKESLKTVRQLQLRINPDNKDKTVLGSMASDLQYSIDWMNTGRRPGNRRGAERLAAYQREKPIDPIYFQNFVANPAPQKCTVKDSDKQRIEDALSVLTERERKIYLMARGQCLSYEQIAEYLYVSKSTVQTTVERAAKKISIRINESLFCICG